MPKLDVSETGDAYFAKLEVPGVPPKGISASIHGGMFVITGEKNREKEKPKEWVHRAERAWGTFARMIPLPSPVDAGGTRAVFTDVVLTVTLPKTTMTKEGVAPVAVG